MVKRFLGFLVILTAIAACSPLSRKSLTKTLSESEHSFKNHIGFIVYDPVEGKTVYEYQSDRYFTPASNTKVLTLFTSLTILGDSLPGIRFVETRDSLIFWGTGDPSLLNKLCHHNSRVLDFLSSAKKPLYYSPSNFYTTGFGPGWAWDDYNDNYSQERSAMPVYGNSFLAYPLPDRFLVIPSYFSRFYKKGPARERVALIRDVSTNTFVHYPGTRRSFQEFMIPFKPETSLVANLLADTLKRPVFLSNKRVDATARTLMSVPADSVYKVMMQESDNHMAEQLLLMCSGVLSDSLKPEIAIRYMQSKYFNDLPDAPKWRDGSGLSRYNLFTPRFIMQVWEKIYHKVPAERLYPLLATGGQSGTIKNWFKSDPPFIYGKTGTLSNNHSLSGFLITKKGRTLIFAFMNGNYTVPVNEVRTNMQRILSMFHENY